MESARIQIEERAVAFLQRRASGEWTDTDQSELTAWLAGSIAHKVAFLRAEAAWEEMGRLKALGAGLPRRKVPTPAELNAAHFHKSPYFSGDSRSGSKAPEAEMLRYPVPRFVERHRLGLRISIAASLVFAAAIGLGGYQLWFTGDRYATPVGGIASIPLQDGSQITLNTRSKVRVVLSDKERHIELAQGEAFFEVAKDASRPFVVEAGGKRVIAVGTKFAVRREGDDIQVVVTEGRVRLEDTDDLPPSHKGKTPGNENRSGELLTGALQTNGKAEVLASAGAIARVRASGISIDQEQPAQAEEHLSWRSGYIVFHETPLAEAVAELNRYNARQIVIRDAGVAAMHLTGRFRATNSEAFINLLEQTFHVRAQRGPTEIVLTDADTATP